MIDWEKVIAYFNLYLEDFEQEVRPLRDYLFLLYTELGKSWSEVADITNGYVSASTLKRKAKLLGVKMRSKGGPNYKKEPNFPEVDYKTLTNTALAKKYKICRQTIIRIAKEKGWPLKKAGKPKALSAPVLDDDTYQGYH